MEKPHEFATSQSREQETRDAQTYLLVFKNVAKARQFVAVQDLDGAEPRMVVRGNQQDIMRIARSAGVVGTLLDYDPTTQKYASAQALA